MRVAGACAPERSPKAQPPRAAASSNAQIRFRRSRTLDPKPERDRRLSTVTREELHAKITRGDAFVLFEVLPHMYYRKHHLPTALSLPPTEVATLVPRLVPDRGTEIVLYCWDDG